MSAELKREDWAILRSLNIEYDTVALGEIRLADAVQVISEALKSSDKGEFEWKSEWQTKFGFFFPDRRRYGSVEFRYVVKFSTMVEKKSLTHKALIAVERKEPQ